MSEPVPGSGGAGFEAVEPARSVGRALIYGCLAGVGTVYLVAALQSGLGLSLLWEALREGQLVEFAAGAVVLSIYTILAGVVGFFLAAPTAFPFIAAMSLGEARFAVLQRLWAWGLLGALFSVPFGLWLAWTGGAYDSDGPADWELAFLWTYMTCGLLGGIAAWLGYYRPLRSVL